MAAAVPVPCGKINVLRKVPTILAAIVLLWPLTARAVDQSVWPLTPYQVQVFVAVARQAPMTPRLESALRADLLARIEGVIGPAWNVILSDAPPELRRAMLYDLRGVQADVMAKIAAKSPEPDKILLVTATVGPGGILVAARDFDVRTRTLSTVVERPVWQVGSLCDAALDAMLAAFAPLARIDRVEKDVAVLRVKASGLTLRDPNLALFRIGDVFRPIVRYNDRENKFRTATPARWSLCAVEKIAPDEVRCHVHSGMRGEMATKGRGRADLLALRVIPPGGSTTILVQSRVKPKKPLAGYDIYAYPPDKKEAVALVGQTDRRGCLTISSDGAGLMKVLLVKNGSSLLAKLPIVPGLEPQLTAEVPNDDQRLAAEGFINGLQEELIDLVAQQKILVTRIKSRMEAKQFDKASELIEQLRQLPTAQQFSVRVTRESEMLATSDAAVQKKIDKLLGDTREAIRKFLDPRILEQLDSDLLAARKGEGN